MSWNATRPWCGLPAPRRRGVAQRLAAAAALSLTLAACGEPPAPEAQSPGPEPADLIIDGGDCGVEPTTVVDWSGDGPVITRHGRGAEEWVERIG